MAERTCGLTGGPSSSCQMIILRNNSHGGRNGQLAKMRPFYQSKRSDNKRYAVEVR